MLRPEIQAQYEAVRAKAAVVDLADTGLLEIRGADRFRWLQGMVSSDIRDLLEGRLRSQPSYILDPTGHILSDLTLVNIHAATDWQGDGSILVALPRGNVSRIAAVLDRFLISEDVEIADISATWKCISFQGPEAVTASQAARSILNASGVFPNDIVEVTADHTGSGGFDWYLAADKADSLLKSLHESSGWAYPEIGEDTLELLRVEAGIPRWGLDLDAAVLAPEAGMREGQVSLTKGCYVGQEVVARIDSRGHTNRALTGFIVHGDRLPAPGDRISVREVNSEDEEAKMREVGRITSLVELSPAAEMRPIGLGYVRHEHRETGTRLVVVGDEQNIELETVMLPFYSGAAVASKHSGERSSL